MATAACDIGEWADKSLIEAAFKRGVKTGAASSGAGDTATLSALKKIIPAKSYANIQTGAFTKAASANKLSVKTFCTKDWFCKMCGGKEAEAQAMAKKMAQDEQDKQDKEAKPTKKGDDVTSRLTDTSKYTGAHKERFDEGGKGKGKDGRVTEAKNTGYVGNYKGDGSYSKK